MATLPTARFCYKTGTSNNTPVYTDLANVLDTNHTSRDAIANLELPSFKTVSGSTNSPFTVVAYPNDTVTTQYYDSSKYLENKYIDLKNYFSDDDLTSEYGSGHKALLAGYLPLSPNGYTVDLTGSTTSYAIKSYTANGSTTRTYKITRNNDSLTIQYLNKTAADIGSIAQWSSGASWPASDFPGGVVPYRVYVQIQAAGGGGGGFGDRAGGGGGCFWAGILDISGGKFIQLGPSGAAAGDATSCYVLNSSKTFQIEIGGGKKGTSKGGAGGEASFGTNTTGVWTIGYRTGKKGGNRGGNAGGSFDADTMYLLFDYLNPYTVQQFSAQSGGSGQPNTGGSGGGASLMGNGGKGGAGILGSDTIYDPGESGGPGYGGGGGGKGNATDRGAKGGNWWISISY